MSDFNSQEYLNDGGKDDTCDRRLSRAAWKLLQRDLMPILLQQQQMKDNRDSDVNGNDRNDDDDSISMSRFWSLLENSIVHNIGMTKDGSNAAHGGDKDGSSALPFCILQDPSQYLFYQEELQSLQISTRSSSNKKQYSKYRKHYQYLYSPSESNMNIPPQYYKCGICGKMFTSPYYLDQHFHHYHYDENLLHEDYSPSNDPNTDTWMAKDSSPNCPATILCHTLLGGTGRCQKMALELEPYYDVGSNGYNKLDASIVRSKWSRVAHAWHCNDTDMALAQERCFTMMNTCFGGEQHEHPSTAAAAAVCDQLTCHNSLHQLLEGTTTTNFLQQIQRNIHEWNLHHDHTVGFWGCLTLALLSIYYIFHLVWKRRQRRSRGNRQLFRRRQRRGSTTLFGSFWNWVRSNNNNNNNHDKAIYTKEKKRHQLSMGILRYRNDSRGKDH